MSNRRRHQPDTGRRDDESRRALMDARGFVLVAAAIAVGVLLYVNPAVGMAVAGGVAVLAALARLVRR